MAFGSTKRSRSVLQEGKGPAAARFIYLLRPPEETNRTMKRKRRLFRKWKKGHRQPHSCIKLAKVFYTAPSSTDVIARKEPERYMRSLLALLEEQLPLSLAHVIIVVRFRSRTTEKTATV